MIRLKIKSKDGSLIGLNWYCENISFGPAGDELDYHKWLIMNGGRVITPEIYKENIDNWEIEFGEEDYIAFKLKYIV